MRYQNLQNICPTLAAGVLAASVLCLLGCAGGHDPVGVGPSSFQVAAPTVTPTAPGQPLASIEFAIAVTPDEPDRPAPADPVRPSLERASAGEAPGKGTAATPANKNTAGARVTFTLITIDTGTAERELRSYVQTAVSDGVNPVRASFPAVPVQPCLARIQITGGHIGGFRAFHGAADLVAGPNTITVAPIGSRFRRDLTAQALSNLVVHPTARRLIPTGVVGVIGQAANLLDRTTVTPYANLTTQIATVLGGAPADLWPAALPLAITAVEVLQNGQPVLLDSATYTPGVPYTGATFRVGFNQPLAAVPTTFTARVRNDLLGSTITLTQDSGLRLGLDPTRTVLSVTVGSGHLRANSRYTITLTGGAVRPLVGAVTETSGAYRFATTAN